MPKDVVLRSLEGQIYVELDEDYLLHVAEPGLIETLPAYRVVLLVDQTIQAYERCSKPS